MHIWNEHIGIITSSTVRVGTFFNNLQGGERVVKWNGILTLERRVIRVAWEC